MKRVRYTKFTGDLASSFGLEDLMEALSDFLLDSGYQDPYSQFDEQNDQTMENLREAIKQALESGELFDEEAQAKFDELLRTRWRSWSTRSSRRCRSRTSSTRSSRRRGRGSRAMGEGEARFEVTDKSMDFLGYKALRELLGPLGRVESGAARYAA